MVRAVVLSFALVACSPPRGAIDAVPDAPGAPDAPATPDAPPEIPAGRQVFAHDRLHRIQIQVATTDLDQLEWDKVNRVPCTLTFDGQRFDNVGIRKKGGYGSLASINNKTGFSIKIDQFVPGQRLDGLKRFLLNSAFEDKTFLSETIGYLSYREFGLVSPLTSHAQVTFNGTDKGIFVIKEAIADDFIERAFGKKNDQGNIYEGFRHQSEPLLGDFVNYPQELDLKDETEGRSRADIDALAKAIRETPDGDFATVVATKLELNAYIKSVALDTILGFWDSYGYFLNNYYLYHSPASGKFVYIPQGMDQLLYGDPGKPVVGTLLLRILNIEALASQFQSEQLALRRNWPVGALSARIDVVEAVLATATSGQQTDIDLDNFRQRVVQIRSKVADLRN